MEGGKSGLFACQLDLRDRKCLGNAVILCQGPVVMPNNGRYLSNLSSGCATASKVQQITMGLAQRKQ